MDKENGADAESLETTLEEGRVRGSRHVGLRPLFRNKMLTKGTVYTKYTSIKIRLIRLYSLEV